MARLLALSFGTAIGALIVASAWWFKHPPTPMQDIELRVVDARGAPVESFAWYLTDQAHDEVICSGESQAFHAGGVGNLRVPKHRISIEVEAKGLHRTHFGPFKPTAIPTRIDAVLADLQVVAGTITYSGQSVAGATVELFTRSSDIVQGVPSGLFYGDDDFRTTSDDRGAFRIGSDWPRMTYYVRAWKPGYAASMRGPVHVGDAPIELALLDGGTIEGVLHLRDDRSAEDVELELYREEPARDDTGAERGERFFARIDHDRRFKFEHIDAGPWLVRARSRDASKLDQLPFVVEVTEHGTAHLDLDLSRPPIQIDGHLTLNGKPFSRAWPSLHLLGDKALLMDDTAIDDDERFVLFVRAPGKYRLVIGCNHEHDTRQPYRISDVVDVPASGAQWRHDIVRTTGAPDEIVLDREH